MLDLRCLRAPQHLPRPTSTRLQVLCWDVDALLSGAAAQPLRLREFEAQARLAGTGWRAGRGGKGCMRGVKGCICSVASAGRHQEQSSPCGPPWAASRSFAQLLPPCPPRRCKPLPKNVLLSSPLPSAPARSPPAWHGTPLGGCWPPATAPTAWCGEPCSALRLSRAARPVMLPATSRPGQPQLCCPGSSTARPACGVLSCCFERSRLFSRTPQFPPVPAALLGRPCPPRRMSTVACCSTSGVAGSCQMRLARSVAAAWCAAATNRPQPLLP